MRKNTVFCDQPDMADWETERWPFPIFLVKVEVDFSGGTLFPWPWASNVPWAPSCEGNKQEELQPWTALSKEFSEFGPSHTTHNFSRACTAYWSYLVACHTLVEHITVLLAWYVPKPPTGCRRKPVRYGYCMWYTLANRVFWTQLDLLWLLNIEFAVARAKTRWFYSSCSLSSAVDPLTAQAETLDLSGTWGNCESPDPDLITHPAHFLCATAH